MKLDQAQEIAGGIVNHLKSYGKIEIVGSIRRKKPWVKDIDLLLVPNNQGMVAYQLMKGMGSPKLTGQKLIRYQLPEITVDIYIATPYTWATLLLIRTGSARHNKKLAILAKRRGLKLHADGSGITRFVDCSGKEERIAGDTEESIFNALGMDYIPPELRD